MNHKKAIVLIVLMLILNFLVLVPPFILIELNKNEYSYILSDNENYSDSMHDCVDKKLIDVTKGMLDDKPQYIIEVEGEDFPIILTSIDGSYNQQMYLFKMVNSYLAKTITIIAFVLLILALTIFEIVTVRLTVESSNEKD